MRAGYCSACETTVWLNEEGGCQNGHGPECISQEYEAEPDQTQTPTTRATQVKKPEVSEMVGSVIGRGLGSTRGLIRKFPIRAVAAIGLLALLWGASLGGAVPDASVGPDSGDTEIQELTAQNDVLADKLADSRADVRDLESRVGELEESLQAATAPACVPEITVADAGDAKVELQEAGYVVVLNEQESEEPEGSVLSCTPDVGCELKEGETVTLVIAVAPADTPAPAPTSPTSAQDAADSVAAPAPTPAPAPSDPTVYITDTGSKYHSSGCRYLSQSQHAISLSAAKAQGYGACSVCKPPG